MLGHKKQEHIIETGECRSAPVAERALVENPDGGVLWAYAETLREAGFGVATCSGEHPDGHDRCPLLEVGHCQLVGGADIIVSTCSSRRATSCSPCALPTDRPRVVFEAAPSRTSSATPARRRA